MRAHSLAYPHDTTNLAEWERGLTKRELFAAMAMQGLLASDWICKQPSVMASRSVQAADALIAELSK